MIIEVDILKSENKRYSLKKSWKESGEQKKRLVAIMHNPNVANEIKGDKSSNLCLNKAVDDGCNEIVIVNLYSTRGEESRKLEPENKVYENRNFEAIEEALIDCSILVLAWGDNPGPMLDEEKFINLLANFKGKIKCFGTNKTGEPSHPRNKGENNNLIDFDLSKYPKAKKLLSFRKLIT